MSTTTFTSDSLSVVIVMRLDPVLHSCICLLKSELCECDMKRALPLLNVVDSSSPEVAFYSLNPTTPFPLHRLRMLQIRIFKVETCRKQCGGKIGLKNLKVKPRKLDSGKEIFKYLIIQFTIAGGQNVNESCLPSSRAGWISFNWIDFPPEFHRKGNSSSYDQ